MYLVEDGEILCSTELHRDISIIQVYWSLGQSAVLLCCRNITVSQRRENNPHTSLFTLLWVQVCVCNVYPALGTGVCVMFTLLWVQVCVCV